VNVAQTRAGALMVSLRHRVKMASGALWALWRFAGGKAAGTWSWTLRRLAT